MKSSKWIKLVSYNIWHGVYLEPMLQFLNVQKPDIVCLQEVGTTGLGQKKHATNLHKVIQSSLDMEAHYGHMYTADEGDGVHTIGVAIYSRFPILEIKSLHYERSTTEVLRVSDKDRYFVPRVLLGCLLAIESKPLWVFTTHFTISPNAQVTPHQAKSAQTVAEYLKEFPEYVLCGDLNTPHGSHIFEILKGEAVSVFGPDQPTLHPSLHRVGNLGLQVDHAFVKSNRIEVISATAPIVDGSDHLPLVFELEVE